MIYLQHRRGLKPPAISYEACSAGLTTWFELAKIRGLFWDLCKSYIFIFSITSAYLGLISAKKTVLEFLM